MVKNYLKIALRNLLRHKGYAFINIFGLAIGLASCMLILLYVQDELSYDRYHEHADQIYRVGLDGVIGGTRAHTANTSAPMAATLVREYPEVVQAVRFRDGGRVLISYEEKRFYEEAFRWADSTVFEVFTFPLVKGDPATALDKPNSLVITKAMAQKYFGSADPIGRIVRVDNRDDFTVTGVMRDLPRNSHFPINFIASMSTMSWTRNDRWVSNSFLTYILLREGHTPDDLLAKFPALIRKYVAPQIEEALGKSYDQAIAEGLRWEYFMEPLTDIHLRSTADNDIAVHGDVRYIYILSAVAVFILLIACINFMNLATARSAKRAKEVGMRKVMGSDRSQLVRQFLGESILLAMLAVVLALVLALAALPLFNTLAGKPMTLSLGRGLGMLAGLLGIGLIAGLLAGIYPAFVLSAFQPVSVLKGQLAAGAKGVWLRRSLVVTQFGISLVLLVGTGIVFKQLRFMQDQKLGFEQEQVVVFQLDNAEARQQFDAFRSELLLNPNVVSVAAADVIPGRFMNSFNGFRPEGVSGEVVHLIWQGRVSHDYLKTLQVDMVVGRDFSRSFTTDETAACIINEAAARLIGWTPEEAVGKTISEIEGSADEDIPRTVIGVVRDFHIEALHEPIKPILLNIDTSSYYYVPIRVQPAGLSQTLAFLEEKWKVYQPAFPPRSFFLNEDFGRLYEQEQRLGRIFAAFAALAIFIACLGLFGLASFMTAQRTKEIGVRKVLGASVFGIVVLLSKEFTRMVLAAALLAFPASYFLMSNWLKDFAYRTNIGIETFLLMGTLTLLIAWLTVGYQSIKAAVTDPVKALRYE